LYIVISYNPENMKNLIYNKTLNLFIFTLIILNVLAVILETVNSLSSRYSGYFRTFEVFSVAVFSVEYILRVWYCTSMEKYSRPLTGRLSYMASPLAVVDLLAILPFYLPMFIKLDLRFLRAIRLFRIFRLLKISRYTDSLAVLVRVVKSKKEELFITAFFGIVMIIIASCLMYLTENEAQPGVFSSIPATMWWCIATLTTVGYGDIYPITPLGKTLGSFIAFLGIGLFALPTGILGAGFVEEIRKDEKEITCPYCGKRIRTKVK